MTPAAKRETVDYLMREFHLSERNACRLSGVSRSTRRYHSIRRRDLNGNGPLKSHFGLAL